MSLHGLSSKWCVRSLTTNHFFDAGNVIFDENIPYHALHEISSTPVDYSPLPFPTSTPATMVPSSDNATDGDSVPPPPTSHNDAPSPPTSDSASPAITTSARPALRTERKLTSVGHLYSASIQAAKAHLEKVRANAERRKQIRANEEGIREEMMREVGNVGNDIDDQFACLCREGVMEDFSDSFGETNDLAAAAASLDVHDYLQRDADILLESVFLSLRSDVACNPQSPGSSISGL